MVAETRPEPAVPPPVRTLHIWPGSVPAGREGVARFTDTEKLLAPGDLGSSTAAPTSWVPAA